MAVSLKKLSKVDLTKPDLLRKLPECTPEHLIDEEETIKSRPAPSPSSDPSPDIEVKQDHVFLFPVSVVIGAVVAALLIALVVFLANNIQVEQSPSTDVSANFNELFSIVSEMFGYILNSPIFLFLLVMSFVALGVHFIRLLLHRF